MAKAKEKKVCVLEDVFKRIINPGQPCIVLVKQHGYRKITDAYLGNAVYVGHGSYGYEFVDGENYEEWEKEKSSCLVTRIKEPQCVLITGKEYEEWKRNKNKLNSPHKAWRRS